MARVWTARVWAARIRTARKVGQRYVVNGDRLRRKDATLCAYSSARTSFASVDLGL